MNKKQLDYREQENVDIALSNACNHGDYNKAQEAITNGANVNINNGWLDIPLEGAIWKGNIEVVKLLVENGADVNADNNSAIREASRFGHLEIVKYLVEQGADINRAIHWASVFGHLEIVKYLVENGANVNKGIEGAAIGESMEVVKFLLEQGADINIAIEYSDKYDDAKNVIFKEELIEYKTSMEEKALLQNDLKEVKSEKQKPVFKM